MELNNGAALLVIAVSSLLILSPFSVEATSRPVSSPTSSKPAPSPRAPISSPKAAPTPRAPVSSPVSSKAPFSSIPSSGPSGEPDLPPSSQNDLNFIINHYLRKASFSAELALDALDTLVKDGSANKTEEQKDWLTACHGDYTSMIYDLNTAHVGGDEIDFWSLTFKVEQVLKALDRCERIYNDLPKGQDNPVKIYDSTIRGVIQKALSILQITS